MSGWSAMLDMAKVEFLHSAEWHDGDWSNGIREPPSRKSPHEVGGKGREVGAPDPPGCSPSKLGGIELNHNVTCMLFKAMANDRRAFRSPTSLRNWELSLRKEKTTTKILVGTITHKV
ncbi:hypothetical protein TNCV_4434671 [Trichonephila clavipes]|nr:hypothetical protein TNCV_4434671 [Trichonephila clavipes]